jgi:hypothetical protein
MTERAFAAGLFGAFVGARIGRALFKWLLDVEGTLGLAATLGVAAVGAIVCFVAERESADDS